MKNILIKIIPLLVGGVLGYAYYHFIGCKNSCPIQSNPYTSVLYGILLGAIFLIPSKKKEIQQPPPSQ
ncbi:MAG: hypothetical protein C0425_01640 [Chlorobiaceae bacterium]|nr:hypothetical protein [Chlorobiaceae bacterium]MBA4309021.1 hypothetical protein [Chlorobiaceae bacterium]